MYFGSVKKRTQGKTCFNCNTKPEAEWIADLKRLTEAGRNGPKKEVVT